MGWKRSSEHKKRMKKLSKVSSYTSGAYYVDEILVKGVGYVKNPKPYYKRYYRANHRGSRYSYYKKHANRQVRRYKDSILRGGAYKKCFDYWWTVD